MDSRGWVRCLKWHYNRVAKMRAIIILNRVVGMQVDLNKAFSLVSQSNNHSIRQGEQLLAALKKDPGYPIGLLQFMSSSPSLEYQLRAAIQLKLWCQFFKGLQVFERDFYNSVIETIKQSSLHAYFNFSKQISKTLRPGLVYLADVLFPDCWPQLLADLLNYAQNPAFIRPVLQLLQDITHKYTYLSRSDPLYAQIIKVCDEMHDYLKDLTTGVLQQVINRSGDTEMLEVLLKLFYNLNYQDLHPSYEDNLQHWMGVLKAVMKLENINEAIFKCKGAALEAILLYANKYKEDVEQMIKDFCIEIWPLCASAPDDSEYDSIVLNCLKFFKSLMNWPDMKPFFLEHMDQIFQTLIIPNISVNKSAIALFEDEPDVYIDYYFRNTQIQTRRAAAIELLRIICRSYQAFQPFLERQISHFLSMTSHNVVAECTLLGLIIDGSSKGFRDVDGCTQLFVNVNIISYCYENIVKKTLGGIYGWLSDNRQKNIENNFNVMHVASLVRFLFYFRIYLPSEEVPFLLQFFCSLKTGSQSLKKVIYLSINGFLLLKHGDFDTYKNLTYYFNQNTLKPAAIDVLRVIYNGTISEQFLQEGLTKMFLNFVKTLKESNTDFFDHELMIQKEMLKRTVQYDFSSAQFLFQAIGLLAYYHIKTNSQHKAALQAEVLDFFQSAIKNKSDLLNFCLQVLAIFLQLQPKINEQYCIIYRALLDPDNWKEDNQSVMSSYIQFIIAYLSRERSSLISDRPAIEIILSKVIQIDHIELFFRFLEAIMLNTTLQEFNQSGYMGIFISGSQAIGQSIQGKKATLLFTSKLILQYGNTQQTLGYINHCCPGFYDQILEASADILQSISTKSHRKSIFSAICKAVQINYFGNPNIEGIVLNSLISNTVDRFHLRNIANSVQEGENVAKKEATYRKLQVFRQFQKPQAEILIDEEEYFVKTFNRAISQRSHLLNCLTDKNKDRFFRLVDKYSK